MIHKNILYSVLVLLFANLYTHTKNNHFETINWGASARQSKRNYMEDYHTVTNFSDEDNPSLQPYFFGIYDGHGGSGVSEELKDTLHKNFYRHWKNKGRSMPEALEYALAEVEEDLRPENGELMNPINRAGSTAVAAVLNNNKLHIANVGDSRAIVVRNGKVIFSTEDHKPSTPKERARIERAGHKLDRVRPGHTPRIKGLSLSRSIGDWKTKIRHPRSIICNPDHYTFSLESGDILIIASDGLWDVLNNEGVGMITKEILSRCKSFEYEYSITERKYNDDEEFEESKSIEFEAKPDLEYDQTHGSKSTMRTLARTLRDMAHEYKSGDNITVIAAQFDISPEKLHERKEKNIDQSIDLLIHNAQELKQMVHQKLNNGLPQILLNNMNNSLKYLKKAVLEELNTN